MSIYIYYSAWDGKSGSHALLEKAAEQYLKDLQKAEAGEQYRKDRQEADLFQNIALSDHGKPSFCDMPQLHFSISHSDQLWACALADCEVGLDLQKDRERDCEKVARRFFHPDEIEWLNLHGFDQFCRIWTFKESYVKYTGDGLTRGLDYFSVVPSGKQETMIPGVSDVFQKEVSFLDGYWMVVTAKQPQEIIQKKLERRR